MARAKAALDLVGHVDVGRLGLAICRSRVVAAFLEVVVVGCVDALDVVGRRGETDDAGWALGGGSGEESGFQKLVEEEVREVVCSKLELVTIGREAEVGDVHDTGVVHEEVDLGGLCENGGRGSADRREAFLVHLDDLHAGRFENVGEGGLGLVDISGCEEEGGASGGQGASGFDADARRSSGNDNNLALESAFSALILYDL